MKEYIVHTILCIVNKELISVLIWYRVDISFHQETKVLTFKILGDRKQWMAWFPRSPLYVCVRVCVHACMHVSVCVCVSYPSKWSVEHFPQTMDLKRWDQLKFQERDLSGCMNRVSFLLSFWPNKIFSSTVCVCTMYPIVRTQCSVSNLPAAR